MRDWHATYLTDPTTMAAAARRAAATGEDGWSVAVQLARTLPPGFGFHDAAGERAVIAPSTEPDDTRMHLEVHDPGLSLWPFPINGFRSMVAEATTIIQDFRSAAAIFDDEAAIFCFGLNRDDVTTSELCAVLDTAQRTPSLVDVPRGDPVWAEALSRRFVAPDPPTVRRPRMRLTELGRVERIRLRRSHAHRRSE